MASEQASSAPDRRRSRVVDRAFQLKYTLMAVAFTVVVSLTYMTMVYLEHFAIEKEIGIYCSATAAAELLQKSASMVGYILVGTLLISLLLTALGVVATHRIAGPIFVMNRYLGVLTAGRIPTMRPLRKYDELKTLYSSLRGFVESLAEREKSEADRLKHAVDTLRPMASTREAQECLENLRAMYQRKCEAIDTSASAQHVISESVEEAA
jgi:nitrogen fixation/metabolism regulation signal transduction histidine kinase